MTNTARYAHQSRIFSSPPPPRPSEIFYNSLPARVVYSSTQLSDFLNVEANLVSRPNLAEKKALCHTRLVGGTINKYHLTLLIEAPFGGGGQEIKACLLRECMYLLLLARLVEILRNEKRSQKEPFKQVKMICNFVTNKFFCCLSNNYIIQWQSIS